MSYDFMKNLMSFEDEERFGRLCQAIEDVINDFEENEGEIPEADVMQALDFIGFNLFRDDWEEFKKLVLPRDMMIKDFAKNKGKKLLN
ncbi:MAG: hypothetical protein ACE5EK_05095 [Nitrospinales bacterium]